MKNRFCVFYPLTNHPIIACGPMPGRKGSGWGSHAGKYGIEAFLVDKAVNFTPTA